MNVWAIADLHLSLAREDRRERFAGRWRNHIETIEREWRAVVCSQDLVLIPGDLSMARNFREVQPDLAWLDRLPGTKVLSAGNHDGWWNRGDKIRPILRKNQRAVDGDALSVGEVIVCGALGSLAVESDQPDLQVEKLRKALDAAVQLKGASDTPIFVLWHYPPFDSHGRPGAAVGLMEKNGVTACVYGHLHAEGQWISSIQGVVNGVLYRCVAADSVGFRPLRIY